MSKSPHESDSGDRMRNRNEAMSDDPGDDAATAAEKAPEEDPDTSAIEAFDEEGAGIAPKE